MAPNAITPPLKLSLLLLLAISISTQSQPHQLKETNMTLYFQDVSAGPNATAVPITGIPGHLWTFASFGTVYCTDDPMTESIEQSSAQVARGQGIYVTSALDGSTTHVLISIVFTNAKFNGSTLEIQGASQQFEKMREVAVVGGTGKFRYAKGFATLMTVYLDTTIAYAVIQCNITVQHY
ncbi:unnamed protein product [Ilex paraguariensis]|uniref:Dirigent protein n=1 Tax=Ilex paraguariensis TaxID=185542 RepID=A0ABC8SPX7_9AQUA